MILLNTDSVDTLEYDLQLDSSIEVNEERTQAFSKMDISESMYFSNIKIYYWCVFSNMWRSRSSLSLN